MKRVFISGQKHFGAQVFNLCRQLGLEVAGVAPRVLAVYIREKRLRHVKYGFLVKFS
jgi:hypothetical protein